MAKKWHSASVIGFRGKVDSLGLLWAEMFLGGTQIRLGPLESAQRSTGIEKELTVGEPHG